MTTPRRCRVNFSVVLNRPEGGGQAFGKDQLVDLDAIDPAIRAELPDEFFEPVEPDHAPPSRRRRGGAEG